MPALTASDSTCLGPDLVHAGIDAGGTPEGKIKQFEHECRIRDAYAERLSEFRPGERLVAREHSYADSKIRGDMRTIDANNVVRIWELEIFASYEGLGQVLTYLAAARREADFAKQFRGVLAAFDFQPEVVDAIEVLNLGVEVVRLPPALKRAGGVMPLSAPICLPNIPLKNPKE